MSKSIKPLYSSFEKKNNPWLEIWNRYQSIGHGTNQPFRPFALKKIELRKFQNPVLKGWSFFIFYK